MTDNLPAPIEPTGVSLGGQAALWADPDGLLTLPVARLRSLAVEVAHDAGPLLAQIRRVAGLVAWAGWHRLNEKDYRTFAAGLAHDLGIEVETLRNWRRAVVAREHLAVPGIAAQRAQTSRSGTSRGKITAPSSALEPMPGAPSAPRERAEPTQERLAPPEPPNAAPAPPERLPSLRQHASAVVDALQDAEEGCGAKWTPEEATFVEGFLAREMANWRRAHGLAQPDRDPRRTPVRAPDIPIQRVPSLARREVTPMFKKAAK